MCFVDIVRRSLPTFGATCFCYIGQVRLSVMPILVDSRGVNAQGLTDIDGYQYPLWSIHMREIQQLRSQLEDDRATSDQQYILSESVCEATRSILYKTDYLTVDAAKQLMDLCLTAAVAVESAAAHQTDGERQSLMRGFASHLRRRAELIADRVNAVRSGS
jgi:hypothetical protein